MVNTIIEVVGLFSQNLRGLLDRSKLYYLAGLFITVVDDQEAIFKHLNDDVDVSARTALSSGRSKILGRPWISGPLCHELFDVLYRSPFPIHVATSEGSGGSTVFIEDHEKASWAYVDDLLGEAKGFDAKEDAISAGETNQISALLLGQASERDVDRARRALAPVREKLASNTPLDTDTRKLIIKELGRFKRATVDPGLPPIREVAQFSDNVKMLLRDFLKHCVFLVRKGEALDRMYEEPQLTLPGALRLHVRNASRPRI